MCTCTHCDNHVCLSYLQQLQTPTMIPITMTAARMSNTMTTPATTPPVLLAAVGVSPPGSVGRLLVHGQ